MLAAPTAKGWEAALVARVLLAVESNEAKAAIQQVLNDDTWRAWRDEEFWSQDWASMDVVTRCLMCSREEKRLEPLTLLEAEHLPRIVAELRTWPTWFGEVVIALQEVVGDRVIRYGGDEFLVLVESGDEDVSELLRQRVEERTTVTISIGATKTSGDSLRDIQRAEAALGQAKVAGRNQAIIAKEERTK